MDFNCIIKIKEAGFTGFRSIAELQTDHSCIPKERGVYLVLHTRPKVDFMEVGSGGRFKGKDPNVPISQLRDRFVNNLTFYIGKAGSEKNKGTLRSRLKQYMDFGKGRPVGHWGGRLIWQIAKSDELLVCWKVLKDTDPGIYESELIGRFKQEYGERPFANLRD